LGYCAIELGYWAIGFGYWVIELGQWAIETSGATKNVVTGSSNGPMTGLNSGMARLIGPMNNE
jgi:hypothetical protein